MSFKVVQVADFPGVSDYCKQVFKSPEIEYQMRFCASESEVIAAARDADVLIVIPTHRPIPRTIIRALPRCRYILGLISGYSGIDLGAATEQSMLITNMPELFWEEVSDHTMALILTCSRKVVELNQLVKRGEWIADKMGSKIGREIWPKLNRLQGQTLGLLGFGGIARSVALKARGFGTRIITYDPYVAPSVFKEFGVESVELNRLLQESDFVSIHISLSEETRHMLGLEQFKKMKPTAYIINTARGSIIDQDALYTALSQGLIEGAALDVTNPEPSNPDNNPLLRLDNVIMTAHTAGAGKLAFANLARLVPEQVFRVARGEWPNNIVNPEVKERYIQKWGKVKEE